MLLESSTFKDVGRIIDRLMQVTFAVEKEGFEVGSHEDTNNKIDERLNMAFKDFRKTQIG